MTFTNKPRDLKPTCRLTVVRAALTAVLCTAWAWSPTAHAGVSIVGTGAAGGMSATTATALRIERGGGTGHMAIIPYFSTQGGNSTLINITNTHFPGKVVKVRFRGAANADSVYSFTVLLKAADVWAANISRGADGRTVLTTSDTSCTLPANVNGAFVTGRLPTNLLSAADAGSWTREGYVEIITMADIRDSIGLLPLARAIGPVAGSGAPLCGTAVNALGGDPNSEAAAAELGLDTPTTGLMVSSILINVAGASVAWTTPTTAITAVDSAGNPARGRMVFSPQTASPAPNIDLYTNDPLLRTVAGGGAGKIAARQNDLPDLSTPYVGTSGNAVGLPFLHVENLAEMMAIGFLSNEFLTDPSIGAQTDWTLTQPLRRFAAAEDYSTAPPTWVANSGVAGPSRYALGAAFTDRVGCLNAASAFPLWFDRDSNPPRYVGFEPRPELERMRLCGVASVTNFGNGPETPVRSTVLSASVAYSGVFDRVDPETYPAKIFAGYARLFFSGAPTNQLVYRGAPIIGASYIQARGPQVAGKSTNFGVIYNHSVSK
jgi:hypothetical protein